MVHERKAGQTPQEQLRGSLPGTGRWLMHAFAWHLRGFVVANVALIAANVWTGGSWWAFWPLVVTSFLLGVHYLSYKAAVVDEHWVDARVEELNLKSYDRSHIEDLKARRGANSLPEADRRS